MTVDEMVGWHHRLDGQKFEQALGIGDGQESLVEKEMATHSSVLAWRISGMGEPGGCRLWGHTESDTTEVT